MISHVNENNMLHQYEIDQNGNYIKASNNFAVPSQVDEWNQWRFLTPKSGAVAGAISDDMEAQFDLATTGHLTTLYFEIGLTEGGTGNATPNPYYIPKNIDIEVNGEVKKFRQLFPDDLFITKMLHRNLIDHNRKRFAEGLTSTFVPTTNNVATAATTYFYIELDFLEQSQPDLRLLKNYMLIRFFFNSPAIFVQSGSTNITLASLRLVQRAIALIFLFRDY